jgi:hypothetical protein
MRLIKKSLMASLILVGLMGNTFSLSMQGHHGSSSNQNRNKRKGEAEIARANRVFQKERDSQIARQKAIDNDPEYDSRQLRIQQENDLGEKLRNGLQSCGESIGNCLYSMAKWIRNLCKKPSYDDEFLFHVPNEIQNSSLVNNENTQLVIKKGILKNNRDTNNQNNYKIFADKQNQFLTDEEK